MHRRLLVVLRRRLRRRHRATAIGGAALVLGAAMPFGFVLREREPVKTASTVAPDRALAPNERFARHWTTTTTDAALHRIRVDLPGLVHVSTTTTTFNDDAATEDNAHDDKDRDPTPMAQIRVSGDSAALVECVEVTPLGAHGLALRLRQDDPEAPTIDGNHNKEKAPGHVGRCRELHGHLLTSIRLARAGHVDELDVRGQGVVVLEDDVLVADAEHARVQVVVAGAGELFVRGAPESRLQRLQLRVAGPGRLHWLGPAGTLALRDRLQCEVAGSGGIDLHAARIEAPLIRSEIAGTGEINVTTSGALVADKLKTSIAGSARVGYHGPGSCRVQRCSVAGRGVIAAPDVACANASVESLGRATVTWQVGEELRVTGLGATTVEYVGDAPPRISGSSVTMRPHTREGDSGDESLGVAAAAAPSPPAPEAAFGAIRVVPETSPDHVDVEAVTLADVSKGLRYLATALLQSYADGKRDPSSGNDNSSSKGRDDDDAGERPVSTGARDM